MAKMYTVQLVKIHTDAITTLPELRHTQKNGGRTGSLQGAGILTIYCIPP